MTSTKEDFGNTSIKTRWMEKAIDSAYLMMHKAIDVDEAYQNLTNASYKEKSTWERQLKIREDSLEQQRKSLDWLIRNENLNRFVIMDEAMKLFNKQAADYVSKVRATQKLDA